MDQRPDVINPDQPITNVADTKPQTSSLVLSIIQLSPLRRATDSLSRRIYDHQRPPVEARSGSVTPPPPYDSALEASDAGSDHATLSLSEVGNVCQVAAGAIRTGPLGINEYESGVRWK